jgi:hypothetical protein
MRGRLRQRAAVFRCRASAEAFQGHEGSQTSRLMMRRFCPVTRIQVGWNFREGQEFQRSIDPVLNSRSLKSSCLCARPGKTSLGFSH